jgi:hypothetical protein
MLPLLLLLVTAQAPAVPGETTLVSFCKNGRLSACEALRQINPQKAAAVEAEAAKSVLRLEALRVAEEEAGDRQADEVDEAGADAAPEPPDCRGQDYHVISRPIARALARHEVLRGLYKPRDKRFMAKAKDEKSHCGYQEWHREVDKEVIAWLANKRKATPEEFMKFLREIYNRPKMRERFPRGFSHGT